MSPRSRVGVGSQTLMLDAESYPGPLLIIAYSHCIAHGYDMAQGLDTSKIMAAESGTGRSTASIRAARQTARRR